MKTRTAAILITAWGASTVFAMYVMAKHDATPGAAPAIHDVAILPTSDKPTLMMFVHPKCPCSRASIEELSTLMAHCGDRVHVKVLFFQPSTEPQGWSRTDTWQSAGEIPGVTVAADVDAQQARRCGAQTSGQVFLYDTAGKLQYEGGLTESRGHVGENDALDNVESLITSPRPLTTPVRSPVFGCAIYSDEFDRAMTSPGTGKSICPSPSPGTPGEGRGEGDFERRTILDQTKSPSP